MAIAAVEAHHWSRAERKTPIYARAGIQEYWILNLARKVLGVFREPVRGAYRLHRGDTWVVTKQLPGHHEAGPVVLRPTT